nr:hypothetical protein [uncultured Dyadobacter sp.]
MIPDKETRDIQAYFRDALPKSRREKFEERMQNDQAFKARVEGLRPILETLEDMETAGRIKEMIESAEAADGEEEEHKIRPLWRKMRYLAAACVIFLLGVFIRDTTLDLRTYNAVYNPVEGATRGEAIDECPDLTIMRLYYKGQDQMEAYQAVIDSLDKKPQGPCFDFYKGMSYLGLENPSKAIPLLLSASKSVDDGLRQNAEWYLSVAYLGDHQKENARALLEKIVSGGGEHRYRSHAGNLLSDLDKKPLLFRFQF